MTVPYLRRTSSLLAVTLLVALTMLVPSASPSVAAGAATSQGKARGEIVGRGMAVPRVKVLWFTQGWTYLGTRKAYGGAYDLSLPAGTYHRQFVDQRPAYDVSKYRPTDITVTVRPGSTTVKNVRMRPGGAIGGTVRAGGKPARGARVVAANTSEQSFVTTANAQGQFALGGLPEGNYSVFTYDRSHVWVGKSAYVSKVKGGTFRSVKVAMNKRAGGLLVDLYAGTSDYPGTAYVTAVSKANGQFWTAKAKHGSVSFRGLYPGGYRLVLPGAGDYLGATKSLKGRVRSSRVTFSSARLTQRGASVTGTVVDKDNPDYPLGGASVQLFNSAGTRLGSLLSAGDGTFRFGGQLTTQGGLTIVVGPGPNSAYLGQGVHACTFSRLSLPGRSVTTGRTTALGKVLLPRTSPAQGNCYAPPPPSSSARLAPNLRLLEQKSGRDQVASRGRATRLVP